MPNPQYSDIPNLGLGPPGEGQSRKKVRFTGVRAVASHDQPQNTSVNLEEEVDELENEAVNGPFESGPAANSNVNSPPKRNFFHPKPKEKPKPVTSLFNLKNARDYRTHQGAPVASAAMQPAKAQAVPPAPPKPRPTHTIPFPPVPATATTEVSKYLSPEVVKRNTQHLLDYLKSVPVHLNPQSNSKSQSQTKLPSKQQQHSGCQTHTQFPGVPVSQHHQQSVTQRPFGDAGILEMPTSDKSRVAPPRQMEGPRAGPSTSHFALSNSQKANLHYNKRGRAYHQDSSDDDDDDDQPAKRSRLSKESEAGLDEVTSWASQLQLLANDNVPPGKVRPGTLQTRAEKLIPRTKSVSQGKIATLLGVMEKVEQHCRFMKCEDIRKSNLHTILKEISTPNHSNSEPQGLRSIRSRAEKVHSFWAKRFPSIN